MAYDRMLYCTILYYTILYYHIIYYDLQGTHFSGCSLTLVCTDSLIFQGAHISLVPLALIRHWRNKELQHSALNTEVPCAAKASPHTENL